VVMASAAEGGGQELLAVTSLGIHADEVVADEQVPATGENSVRMEQLGLPYP
jgi:hypothetical protein